jgi:hypothetical protein
MEDIIYNVLTEALNSSFGHTWPDIQEENRMRGEAPRKDAFFHHWEYAEQLTVGGIDSMDLAEIAYHLCESYQYGKSIWGEREKDRGELFYVADPSHIDGSDIDSSIYLTRTSGHLRSGWVGIENASEMTTPQKIAAALTTESLEITTETMFTKK